MNESITCEEVLHLARHLHACMDEVVKSLQLLAAGADGVVLSARSAGAFRTLADYIEWPPSMAATKAGITLRRAADQIAPTAEPDLTTVEGWNTLCDLVGRLRSGDLVPGLVATPDVCGGALRIDGTDWSVVMVADEITRFGEYDDWTSEEAVYALAADLEVDPDLVEVAARVGGADEPAAALLERIAAEQATAKPTRLKKAVTADG